MPGEPENQFSLTRASIGEPPLTAYDSVLYPSDTHPQTHPSRLAVIGALFGLEPAPVERCRVLELGCGNGSNLVPMAWGLPHSKFAGIDLASRPIARGQEMIRDLGVTNVRLIHGDLRDITGDWGKFDYIIAHGLYSWVPAPVRQAALELCRRLLTPRGLAFVSYNAYPGCHLRQMVREMMLFHVHGCPTPEARVGQSVALARFLAEAQDGRDEYRLWMKAELARIMQHDEGHLYHDELSDVNDPFYFTQFMDAAASHGLQYLGEADFHEMSDHTFNEDVRAKLRELGTNRILREQYLDFLKCRPFRQTLLCQLEVELATEPQVGKIAEFLVSSPARCTEGQLDLHPGVSQAFQTPRGARFETDLPAGKAALAALEAAWPMPLNFATLLEQAAARLHLAGLPIEQDSVSPANLSDFLLRLYGAGIVEFRTCLPPITTHLNERPHANPVARWQAQHGLPVTSLLHIAVRVDGEIGSRLIGWLDGTRDRKDLVAELWQWLKAKDTRLAAEKSESEARSEIEKNLEVNLKKLARLGLFVG